MLALAQKVTLRAASGALVAGEIGAASNLLRGSSAIVVLDVTTLTLPDADDEVDFYVQCSYDGGVTWTDVENVHFTNADDGSTARRIVVVDGAANGKGRIQSITGTDPAAAAEISETVPANTLWKLRALRIVLVTDANAANRGILVDLNDGANSYHRTRQPDVQTASLTRQYNYSLATYFLSVVNFTEFHNVLPDVILAAGHVFQTVTGSIQAGDDYGAPQYEVEAWHDPRGATDGTMGDNLKSYNRPVGSQMRIRTAVAGATAPTYAYSAIMLLK